MAAQGDHGCLWPDTLPSTGSGKASLRGNPRITTRYVRDLRPFSQDPWGLHNPSCPWRRINSIHVTGGRGEGLARRKCLIHVSCQDHGPGLVHGAPLGFPSRRGLTPRGSLECNPAKGDQSWVFIGRTDFEAATPVLWPIPDENNRKDVTHQLPYRAGTASSEPPLPS